MSLAQTVDTLPNRRRSLYDINYTELRKAGIGRLEAFFAAWRLSNQKVSLLA